PRSPSPLPASGNLPLSSALIVRLRLLSGHVTRVMEWTTMSPKPSVGGTRHGHRRQGEDRQAFRGAGERAGRAPRREPASGSRGGGAKPAPARGNACADAGGPRP